MLPMVVLLHWPCTFSSTEVFMNTIEAISIAFCCLLLLMLAVGVGCVYKMFDNKQGVCGFVCVREKSIDWKCVTEFVLDFHMYPPLISFTGHAHIPTTK